MDTFWRDLRYGFRMLRKNPGFTLSAILTLSLGIGLNSAVFSVMNAILFRPLPVERPEELVALYNRAEENLGVVTHEPMAYPDYRDIRDAVRTIDGMFAYSLIPLALERGDENEVIIGDSVTETFFTTLGVRAVRGRTFLPDVETSPAGNPVAVLSHAAWQRRFGGDPQVIGSRIRLNGTLFTVIGVTQPEFTGLLPGIAPELWVPMRMMPTLRPNDKDRLERRNSRGIWVMGRLKPGSSVRQAQAEVQTINSRLKRDYPETNRSREVDVLPAAGVKFMPGLERVLYAVSGVLLGVVGLVLMIACANVANMLLARAGARRKEMAVRLALGASRGRLVRQLLLESLQLALGGGAVGLLIAGWSNAALNAGFTSLRTVIPVPLHLGLQIDYRVLFFAIAVAALTAAAFGLAPALAATRVSGALQDESGTIAGGRGKNGFRNTLVVTQVAVSLVLLICAGLSLRSMWNARRVDPGFEATGVIIASTDPSLRGYSPSRIDDIYAQLAERVRSLPGVESTAYTSMLPLTFEIRTTNVTRTGDPRPRREWPEVDSSEVGPGYFSAMRIPLLRGRAFSEADRGTRVVVVNEALVRKFWPGLEPVGQRLRIGGSENSFEVIGVAHDSKYRTLGESPRPYVYEVMPRGAPVAQTLLVRVTGDPRSVLPAVRQELRSVDERLPVLRVQTLEEAISVSLLFPRAGAALFGLFGLLGLMLASVGLYGVLAYAVSQRKHEIGVRMAVGAQMRDILGLVVGQGLSLALLGVGIGAAVSVAATRIIEVLLYGISATDVPTFAAVSLVLLTVAALACYIPARRAAKVEPTTALRHQ